MTILACCCCPCCAQQAAEPPPSGCKSDVPNYVCEHLCGCGLVHHPSGLQLLLLRVLLRLLLLLLHGLR